MSYIIRDIGVDTFTHTSPCLVLLTAPRRSARIRIKVIHVVGNYTKYLGLSKFQQTAIREGSRRDGATKTFFALNILFILLRARGVVEQHFFPRAKAAVATNTVRAVLFAYPCSYVTFYFGTRRI